MRKLILFLLCAVSGGWALGQQNFSLFGFEGTAQANYSRPTSFGPSRLTIGVPGISRHEFALQQNFVKLGLFNVENDFQAEFEQTVSDLGSNSSFWFQMHSDLLFVGIGSDRNYWSFGVYQEINTVITPPSDLIKMAVNGNKPYVNQIVDMSYFNVAAEHYVGVHLGLTRRVTDKWTLGGRIKLINGIAGVRSDVRQFDVGIVESNPAPFEWIVSADMTLNTAGIRQDVYTNYWNPQNLGYGLDFGAEYQLDDQFSFAFGVRDLGAIYWRDDSITNYHTRVDDFRFEGVYYNVDDERTFDEQVEAFTDTLLDVLEFSDTTGNWRSALPSKWNLGARYSFTEKQQLGLDYFYFNHSGSPLHAVSLSYYGDYSDYLSLRAQTTLLSNQGFNMGASAAIGKYFQFVLGVDYLHYAIRPDFLDGLSFGFGFNVNLGYGSRKEKKAKRIENSEIQQN
jgi:hypothetical protein